MDRLDRFFGVQGQALALSSKRMQVLASNIANAATPGFRARDLDFAAVLQDRRDTLPMRRTAAMHLDPGAPPAEAPLRYRLPVQGSLDGNTVELATEQVQFAETALRYRATLAFLDGRIATVKAALKGE
ncbi:MAG: flagellar basal body rod protein FlgB [Sphingomonadaceae bacterium]